jgi:predicted nuclease of restriction endonuclease-like RecB superfamily
LGRDWPEIEASLFADIIDFQRLVEFDGYPTAAALLARYNVGQFQVALFDATEITIRAKNDFKTILRRAKLARLMHSIRRVSPDEYEIRLDGPASLLRQTRRYGTAMAKFIPSLLACRDWSLHSLIRTRRGGWTLALTLTHADGLSSPQETPEDFDSTIEETFAAKWGSEPREGWTLHRETAILQEGQKIFVPDFEFRHTDGTMIAMEIIGFWTPEYLEAKRQTLQHFSKHRILLAIAHSVEESLPDLGQPRIVYKTVIKLDDVLQALKSLRAPE